MNSLELEFKPDLDLKEVTERVLEFLQRNPEKARDVVVTFHQAGKGGGSIKHNDWNALGHLRLDDLAAHIADLIMPHISGYDGIEYGRATLTLN
jgi:hypothetical protein